MLFQIEDNALHDLYNRVHALASGWRTVRSANCGTRTCSARVRSLEHGAASCPTVPLELHPDRAVLGHSIDALLTLSPGEPRQGSDERVTECDKMYGMVGRRAR